MALMSISRIISQHAAEHPDWPSITHEGKTVTRREMDLRTNRLARAYQLKGVKRNDFVTVALPNSIEFYEACVAIWKLGAIPQPVSYRLPEIELSAVVELANPSLIVGVGLGSFHDRQILPAGFQADPQLSDEPLPDAVARYWKALTSGGSTGRPKLIVSEDPGEVDLEQQPCYYCSLSSEENHLVPGPLYHNGPFTYSMMALFRGCYVVSMSRFDAEETLALIEKYKIAWVMMVPTMMHRIWRLAEETRNRYDLSSLRVMLHLAAPCPVWLKEKWIEWLGNRVYELYAGTEGLGVTWITSEEWLARKGSVGKLVTEGQIKIFDENGQELPAGEIGEIFFLPAKGQGSSYHYIGAEARAIAGGWESLGDLGYMDNEGYLYLCDRRKDLIISGGANIYPAEVEGAIDSFPGVRSSAVVGVPDEDLGQSVHAIVDAPGGIDQDSLLAHLAQRLVRYKIPRSFEFVNKPLRDDAGKTRRTSLRKEKIQSL